MSKFFADEMTMTISLSMTRKAIADLENFIEQHPEEFEKFSTRSELFLSFLLKGVALTKDEIEKKAKFKAQEATRSV